jgi:SAM-dependent methyltransferase
MSTMTSTIAVPAIKVHGAPDFTCAACGHVQSTPRPFLRAITPDRPFDWVRCPDCTLVQQFPRGAPAQLRGFSQTDETDGHIWARAVQQYVMQLLPMEDRPARRLLDVGCGLGHRTALARMRGWRVTGIDSSPEAVSQASVRFGLDVRAGKLARHRDTLGPFDAVFVGEALARAAEPAALLVDVRRCLGPDGIVCIDTQNWAARSPRWRRGGLTDLDHRRLNYFDAESLGRLLETCGFLDIRIASYASYRPDAASTLPRWLRFLPRFVSTRVARWFGRWRSTSAWTSLGTNPPTDLDQTGARLAEYAVRADEAWTL